jgi:hypothetical protein
MAVFGNVFVFIPGWSREMSVWKQKVGPTAVNRRASKRVSLYTEFRHCGQSGVQRTLSRNKFSHDRHVIPARSATTGGSRGKSTLYELGHSNLPFAFLTNDTWNCKTSSIERIILNHAGRWFDSRCHCIFQLTIALRSPQSITVMTTRNIPAICKLSRKYGKLWQTYGPPRSATGITLTSHLQDLEWGKKGHGLLCSTIQAVEVCVCVCLCVRKTIKR